MIILLFVEKETNLWWVAVHAIVQASIIGEIITFDRDKLFLFAQSMLIHFITTTCVLYQISEAWMGDGLIMLYALTLISDVYLVTIFRDRLRVFRYEV